MFVCLFEGQVLGVLLLVDHQDVDVVAAAETVVGHREQGVGIRWQPDAHHTGGQWDDGIDQAGSLMAETVVVVTPAGTGEQHVERCHRFAPWQFGGVLQPLGVLHQHGDAHHRERLVGGEKTVAAGQ